MELKVGMKLELIKDLDCGIRVIEKGEVFRVQHISANKVSLINNLFNKNISFEKSC